jgi:PAS domain S-box-containing protein
MNEEENSSRQSSLLLQESEPSYKLLVESVHDYAIFMLDTRGRIVTWNIGAERIKGYRAEEIIGRHFSIFYPPEVVAANFTEYELKKAREDGRFEDEGWRVRKDGSTFWANVVITPVYNATNTQIGYSKITRDLTERVRNEELMKKNKELHKINTDLDNFIYTASHDLKSPVVNLEGLLSILSKKLNQTENSSEKEILEMMKVSISNLNKTITNLTEITKVQKDVEESLEVVSFQEVLTEVKADIAQLILDSKAIVEEVLDMKEILFNRAYLRSIIYNLLTNAIKYRSPVRPLEIKISTYREFTYSVLSVKDNGLGLTKDQQSKLFSLFRRFHSHVEGSGTGLYLIKRIIENRNGRVEVESELEAGSEFKVFFASN